MAKRTPFTSQEERLERLIKNARAEVVALKGMVNTARSIVAAQFVKIDDPSSPQILRVSEGGTLEMGSESPMRVIGSITEGVSHAGDVDETEVGKIVLPANSMGANGTVRVTGHFLADGGGAGNRIFRMYFGGTKIANFGPFVSATLMLDSAPIYVWNRGATNDQEARSLNAPGDHFRTGDARTEMAINTTADVDITFTVQNLGGAGLSSRLRHAFMEAYYHD